jgi:hypothetical protein
MDVKSPSTVQVTKLLSSSLIIDHKGPCPLLRIIVGDVPDHVVLGQGQADVAYSSTTLL